MNAGYGIFISNTISITLENGQIININDGNIQLPNYYVSYVLTQPKTIPVQVYYDVSNIPSAIFEDYIPITAKYRYYVGDFASVKVIPRLLVSYQLLDINLDKYIFSIDLKQLEEYFVDASLNGTIDIIGINDSDIRGISTANGYTYEYKYNYSNLEPNELKDLFDKARESKDEEYFVNHPKECGAPDYVESLSEYERHIVYKNIFRPILICKFLYDFNISDISGTLSCNGENSYIKYTEDFISRAEEALTEKIFDWDQINNWWKIFEQVIFCRGKCKDNGCMRIYKPPEIIGCNCEDKMPANIIGTYGLGGINITYQCGQKPEIEGYIKFSYELDGITLNDLISNYNITEGIHIMFFGDRDSTRFRDDVESQFKGPSTANRICARILCTKFSSEER